MNPSFIKILRFEWKSNYILWIFNLIISFSAISLLLYSMSTSSNPSGIREFYFFIFILLTCLFTLNSYQESTNSQSMHMYHLIGVSSNIKFLSKQLITLLGFPFVLIGGTYLLVSIINIFNLGNEHLDLLPRTGKVILWFVFWIVGQSISTLLAIVFKKNKVLYAVLTFFIMRIVIAIVLAILVYAFNSMDLMKYFHFSDNRSFWEIIGLTGVMALAAVFYGISYHLFFRRQL